MKDDVEYRIREYCGVFEIEIRGYEEKGMFWWKRKEWSWCKTNAWGGVRQTWPVIQPLSEKFKTLEAALERVAEWKKGATFHCA